MAAGLPKPDTRPDTSTTSPRFVSAPSGQAAGGLGLASEADIFRRGVDFSWTRPDAVSDE
jgi:hypothetical protein